MRLKIFLLRLYPRAWRERYEEEFLALLEQTDSSPLDLADVALGALDAHLKPQVTAASVGGERRPIMSRTTFLQGSAVAAMIGSVLLFIVIGRQLMYSIMDGLAADSVGLTGVVLMLIGVVGFGFAYARRTGGLGQVGLVVAFLGLSSLTLGFVGSVMDKVGASLASLPERGVLSWGALTFYGWVGMCAGMALFALAGLRQQMLAIPAAWLLLVGGTCGAAGHTSLVFLVISNSSDVAVMASKLVWVFGTMLFLVGFFLLGSALWSGRGAVVQPVEHPLAG
jgi:hypothetical protein